MMSLDASGFLIHDIGKFPVVSVKNEAVVPGYARQWASEMDALMANGNPFAIVYRGAIADETDEDSGKRGQWLNRNRQAIARLCRVLVVVEPDEIMREQVRMLGRSAAKAFGVPHRVVATTDEAADILFHRVGTIGLTGSSVTY